MTRGQADHEADGFNSGDRVDVDCLNHPDHGETGTVQWVQNTHKQTAYGVRLDSDPAGKTFFRHELAPAHEEDA